MTKTKKLPKGVVRAKGGKFRGNVSKQGERLWSPYFGTVDEAEAWTIEVRSGSAASARVWGNDKVRELLSKFAFDELMSYAEDDTGGIIDTSAGSDFDIWRRAARECRVELKPASELFCHLDAVVLSFDDSMRAKLTPDNLVPESRDPEVSGLLGPAIFIRELRKLEALGLLGRLDEVNLVLQQASMAGGRMTLEEVTSKVLNGGSDAEA